METYPNLPTPAGPYSRCGCGAYGAVVHDNRVWCIACHVDSLFTPEKLVADAYRPPPMHERGRASRRRRASRAHLRDEHQGY